LPLLFGAPFTATSMIGFIAPAGVIVRNGIEMILDDHFHFVAAAPADDRSEDRRRVAVRACRLSRNEGVPAGHGFEIDGVSRCRRVDQPGDR
jgi:hypothetical protein